MVISSTELNKRAQQIINDKSEEIEKLEAQLLQMKTARFICAECRQSLCVCIVSNFKEYTRKRKRIEKKIDTRCELLDLQLV